MNRARNKFLAGPRLPEDQHARIRGCDYRYETQRSLEHWALSHDFAEISANFLFEVESLFCFLISVLCRLFVFQRVFNCNRNLRSHLLEQDDVVLLKRIVRTPAEHQNAKHAITACERKITPRLQAFLDHGLINRLAVRIPINFRIIANLSKTIDQDRLALP